MTGNGQYQLAGPGNRKLEVVLTEEFLVSIFIPPRLSQYIGITCRPWAIGSALAPLRSVKRAVVQGATNHVGYISGIQCQAGGIRNAFSGPEPWRLNAERMDHRVSGIKWPATDLPGDSVILWGRALKRTDIYSIYHNGKLGKMGSSMITSDGASFGQVAAINTVHMYSLLVG